MLRSNSKRTKTAPAAPLVPTATAAPKTAPTDPAPTEGVRPADVLIARLNEVKRISKSLVAYFDSIARAHTTYSTALAGAASPEVIKSPFLESSLFLPTPVEAGGKIGWADLLVDVRASTTQEADAHAKLAGVIQENVVRPLRQIRLDIKHFISDLDKEVGPLTNDVVKKRETSVSYLTNLATALAAHVASPLTLSASEDPFIVRASAEQQLREQVTLENDLLSVVLEWQEATRAFEYETFTKFKTVWAAYDTAKAEMDHNTPRSQDVSTRVSTMPPNLEWSHFASLNHLIPSKTALRSLDQITYPNRGAPAAIPIKEGVLERKKRFTKSWKQAFFVISPAGYFHEYATPSTPLSEPNLSLFLPHCQVGPLPPPVPSSSGKLKEIKFTIEGRRSVSQGGIRGSLKIKHREVGWSYRARSWEEAKGWWIEVEKFTKTTLPTTEKSLVARQGTAPSAVQRIGLAPENGAPVTDEDPDTGGSSDEEEPEVGGQLGAVVEEEKPEYSETPGVVSGAARDKKVKMAPFGDPPLNDEVTQNGHQPQPSTSRQVVEETTPYATPVTTPGTEFMNPVSTTNGKGTVEAPVSVMKDAPASQATNGTQETKKKKRGSFFSIGTKKD